VPGRQSNNTAEIFAVKKALETAAVFNKPVHVFTDSQYVIDSMSKYERIYSINFGRDNRNKVVANLDLIGELYNIIKT